MGKKPTALLMGVLVLACPACDDDLDFVYEEQVEDAPSGNDNAPAPRTALPPAGPGASGPRQMSPAPAQPRPSTPQLRRRTLRLFCSPSGHRIVGRVLERPFERAHEDINLVVLQDTDRNCVEHVAAQDGDAAVVCVQLSRDQKKHDLREKVLGYRIVVPVVHPKSPLASLLEAPLRKVLDGRIRDWSEVGGPRYQIQPVCITPDGLDDPAARLLRMKGRAAERAVQVVSGDVVLRYVARSPHAIGLVTLAGLETSDHNGVKRLAINHVRPTAENYVRGRYPMGCVIQIVHQKEHSGELAELLKFLDSPAAKQALRGRLTLP